MASRGTLALLCVALVACDEPPANTNMDQGAPTGDSGTDGSQPTLAMSVSAPPSGLTEGGFSEVTVTLTGTREIPVDLEYTADDDLTLSVANGANGRVTVPAGTDRVQLTFTVTATQDSIVEPSPENASFTFGPLSSSLGMLSTPTVTRQLNVTDDDDGSDLAITLSADTTDLSESGTVANVTASVTSPLAREVSVAVTVTDETEALPGTATLTFDPNTLMRTFTVAGVDDDIDDGDQTFDLRLAAARLALTTSDDDTSGVSITSTETSVGEDDSVDVSVALDSEPIADVTVALNVTPAAAASVAPTELTFTASNWDMPQSASVSVPNNDAIDPASTITVSAVSASGGDTVYSTGLTDAVMLDRVDNDSPALVMSSGSLSPSVAAGVKVWRVRLGSQPLSNVVVDVSLPGASATRAEFVDDSWSSIAAPTLTFTTSNWDEYRSVFVRVIPTGNPQEIETSLAVNAAGSTGSGYELVAPVSRSFTPWSREPTRAISTQLAMGYTRHDGHASAPSPNHDGTGGDYLLAGNSHVSDTEAYHDAILLWPFDGAWSQTTRAQHASESQGVVFEQASAVYYNPLDVDPNDTNGRQDIYAGFNQALSNRGSSTPQFFELDTDGGTIVAYAERYNTSALLGQQFRVQVLHRNGDPTTLLRPADVNGRAPVNCNQVSVASSTLVGYRCQFAAPGANSYFESHAFLHDLSTGIATRVSVENEHTLSSSRRTVAVAAARTHVAFVTTQSLVATDNEDGDNSDYDLYIWERANGSYQYFPGLTDAYYSDLTISANGGVVTMVVRQSGVSRVAFAIAETGQTGIASMSDWNLGTPAVNASNCIDPEVAGNGRYVWAACSGTDLVDHDTNAFADIYRFPLP